MYAGKVTDLQNPAFCPQIHQATTLGKPYSAVLSLPDAAHAPQTELQPVERERGRGEGR